MKIKIALVAFMLLFVNGLLAQSTVGPITITHGQEIAEDSEKIVRIAGEANGKIYTLANKGKDYFIKVFSSSDMALQNTFKIELDEFNGKDINFEDITVIDGVPFIFGSVFDKKAKTSNLFGVKIGADGALTGQRVRLFNTSVTKKREQGAFYFKESPVGDKILILHATLFDKEEKIQYEAKLFDADLNEVMAQLEQVPFEDRRDLEFTISDFDVNVNDNVFIVINESYRDRKAKKNIEKFEVHAYKSGNGYGKEVINIDFTGKEVINCEMLANQDNQLQLVGFYSSVRKNGKANKELKGVYAGIINLGSNSVENLNFNEFDLETKIKLIGERRAKKGKDVKPRYVPHTLIEREDGGLILLSEYQLVGVGRSSGIGPLAFTPITYINNEIIVTSINPDGTVGWSNVVPKEQKAAFTVVSLGLFGFAGNGNFSVQGSISIPLGVLGKGPEYLSAMPIYKDGELTIVINDNTKNVEVTDIEDIKPLGNYNKAVPAAFLFDSEGNMTRIDQENSEERQLVLRPNVFYRTSPTDYIIYSSRKTVDKLGRMSID